MDKIGIIGVGQIGGTLAHLLLRSNMNVAIKLYDIHQNFARGKALDLFEASVIGGYQNTVCAVDKAEDLLDCRVVVITAGLSRRPGMDRKDLVRDNGNIIGALGQAFEKFKGIVIIVTNPVDLLTWWFLEKSRLPEERVLGMAGLLDQGRLRARLSERIGLAPQDISGVVVGSHSDQMVVLSDHLSLVGAGPLQKSGYRLSAQNLSDTVLETQTGGARIVNLMEKGSAFYGPAEATLVMVSSIIKDQKKVVTCSTVLSPSQRPFLPERAFDEVSFGWPIILGKNGRESAVDLSLDPIDQERLSENVQQLKKDHELLKSM